MKRFVSILLLCALLLALCACGADRTKTGKGMSLPVLFYYCGSDAEEAAHYEQDTGALQWEYRDLGTQWPEPKAVLELYLEGPVSESLRSPFPEDVFVREALLEDGLLTVRFNDALSQLSGVDMTMAAACLVYTMAQYPGVEFVQLDTETTMLSGLTAVPLETDDFLKMDDYMTSDHTVVRLYFPKPDGRFLRVESRSGQFESSDELPAFVLRQLLAGSSSSSALPAFPEGTELLNIQVTDGFCTVDLSSEFVSNAPDTSLEARSQLLSIVNTLTDLDTIAYVRLLSQGEPISDFGPLELPVYLTRAEEAIETSDPSVVRDVTLYLPSGSQGMLSAVPVYVRKMTGKSFETEVLNTLLSFESGNGYFNAIPGGTTIVELQCEYKVCRVTLSNSFMKCDDDKMSAQQAVRSIVATLCGLETVERVEIKIVDGDLQSVDLSKGFTASKGWIMP